MRFLFISSAAVYSAVAGKCIAADATYSGEINPHTQLLSSSLLVFLLCRLGGILYSSPRVLVCRTKKYYLMKRQEKHIHRNTNTAALGKGFLLYRTGLYSFFHQFVYLFSVYVILPMLNCTQAETRLCRRTPLPHPPPPIIIHALHLASGN